MRSVNLNVSLEAWPQVEVRGLGGWFYVVLDYRPWPLGSLRTKHLPETPRLTGLMGYALGLDILAMA
jgi:hypothetical protein